jgi:hypothetical protein
MLVFSLSEFVFKIRYFIYLIALSLLSIFIITDLDISILFYVIFWILIGNIIIHNIFKKENISTSKKIFHFSFFVYVIFMSLAHFLYIDDPFTTYFYAPDSADFYKSIFTISQIGEYNGPGLLDLSNQRVLDRGTGIFYMGWIIGRISYALGGTNSLVIHQLVIVWCVSLINVFLYNASRYYLDNYKSKVLALAYGLFSFNLIYSSILLRDLQVALLLTIGFYIILGNFKIKNLFILISLAVVTFIFRPTHGVYYLLIIIYYLYIPLSKYKLLVPFFFLLVLFLFFTTLVQTDYNENLVDRSQIYTEYHSEKIEDAGGGASRLYAALPAFTHPFISIIQSQINPFALLGVYVVPTHRLNSGQSQYLSFVSNIAYFLWFVIWFIILYAIVKIRFRLLIPKKLFFIFLLAMILLLLGGFSSSDPRRLLGVYPAIYLTAMCIYFKLERIKQKRIVNIAVIVFIISGVTLKIIV